MCLPAHGELENLCFISLLGLVYELQLFTVMNELTDDLCSVIMPSLLSTEVYMDYTVQLTGNVVGTHTKRHASTQETCEGAGMLRGIASKTRINREFNYS